MRGTLVSGTPSGSPVPGSFAPLLPLGSDATLADDPEAEDECSGCCELSNSSQAVFSAAGSVFSKTPELKDPDTRIGDATRVLPMALGQCGEK